VLGDHQDWLVVTLEPWLEEEELLLELLDVALLDVVAPESSSEVVLLDVPESLSVAVSSEVAFACCDALLVDAVEPM
jgi:hypothetical protein